MKNADDEDEDLWISHHFDATRNSNSLCLGELVFRAKSFVKNIRLQKCNDFNMRFLYRRMKGKVFDHETRQFRHI